MTEKEIYDFIKHHLPASKIDDPQYNLTFIYNRLQARGVPLFYISAKIQEVVLDNIEAIAEKYKKKKDL